MAPNHFLKPETAHAKAKELIGVGKRGIALEILYEMLKFRRARNWQKSLEEPMLMFVDLCIELRKNQHFKRIIHQYRNITIQECPESLDLVLKHYFSVIKAKTEEARQESKDSMPDIEDLDIAETPESLMLNAVSTEGAQGRSDHTILMPWLKFLWEAFRIGLDLVRNNSKFEDVYHRIAQDAFDFCVEYRRKNEFRKLSEMLRIHTARIQTQPAAQNAISLTNSDTLNRHLETRLRQLDCATELELYNEAFRIVEDTWGLVLLAKKIERPSLMADYYSKTAELFLRSGCYLFHAAALFKRLNLYREHKRAQNPEELSALGSKALCASLSIPLPHARSQMLLFGSDQNQAKQKALANLLGLSTVPTRSSLLSDLSTGRVQHIVPTELAQLYQALEVDFQPLKLVQRVKPALEKIAENPALSVYQKPLHEIIVSKTLLQLSQVYRSLHFSELVKLCPFYEPLALERCIIELIYNLELPMRVDHRRHAIIFDVYIDLGISQKDYAQTIGLPVQSQAGSTDQLSRQLALFAQSLQQVTEVLNINEPASSMRDKFVDEYRRTAQKHHRELLARRYCIEERKEQLEKMQDDRAKLIEKEEQRIADEKQELLKQDIEQLKKEELERERMKTEEEQIKLKRKIALERYMQFKATTVNAKAEPKDITDEMLDQITAESLLEKRRSEIAKKNRDVMEKANARAKKLDHLTRAMRLVEIPLIREVAEKEQLERRQLHERQQDEAEENSRKEHENRLKHHARLSRMKADVAAVTKALKEMATAKYKQELAEWEELCSRVRTERLAERAARLEAEKQAAEEAERLQREAEEAERIKLEAEEAERAKREAERAKREAERAKRETEEAERRRQAELDAQRVKNEAEAKAREEEQKRNNVAWLNSRNITPGVGFLRGDSDISSGGGVWCKGTALRSEKQIPAPVFESKFRSSVTTDALIKRSGRATEEDDGSGSRSSNSMGASSGWVRKSVVPKNPGPRSSETIKMNQDDDDGWRDAGHKR